MKNVLMVMLTGLLLASCTPKGNTTTDTTGAATGTATTDSTGAAGGEATTTDPMGTATTDATAPDATTADSTADSTTTDTPGSTDSAATGTSATDAVGDTAASNTTPDASTATDTAGGAATSAAGDQTVAGTVGTYDGTAQTFTVQQDGQDYNVTVDSSTTYQGGATSADEFFGTDRADANVSVEGAGSGSDLVAKSVTLN